MDKKLHLVTVATHSERYLPVLERQSQDKNMDLVKLGYGKKYEGHFMKDMEMIAYLKTVPPSDIVIFVDGFDTLLLADKQEILKKYESYDAKLILSVENITMMLSYIHAAVFERVATKYINTGLYMGEAGFLLKFLEDMYSQERWNLSSNQKTWCTYLNKLSKTNQFDDIKLDVNSDLFLNHSFTTYNWPRMREKRVTVDDHAPCFIQGNGCEDMTHIINKTGYADFNIHKDEFWWKKMSYNMKAIFKIYNPILTFYISLLTLLIVLIIFFSLRWRRKLSDEHFYLG